MAAADGDALSVASLRRRRVRDPVSQTPRAHAGLPLALRVQPRQLRAATPGQPGPVCMRAGAGDRDGAPAPGSRERTGWTGPFGPAVRMKLACIVQRYGADIAGGSEAHCRELA